MNKKTNRGIAKKLFVLLVGLILIFLISWFSVMPKQFVSYMVDSFGTASHSISGTDSDTSTQEVIPLSRIIYAKTESERSRGLSGFKSLPNDIGILFIFEKSDYYEFWMKDMLFPIDIVWLDENFRVISVKNNIYPDTYPQTFKPESPARYVLEVNAGLALTNHYTKGNTLDFLQ